MKKLLSVSVAAAAAVTIVAGAAPAGAVTLPCNTAKLIVPWKAGGGTHVIFSIFENGVNKLGVKPRIQVVTIPGQGGNKGAKEAVKAKPDGCTLFAIHQSAITSYFTGRVDFTWDAFEPVILLTRTPAIYGARADAPFDNVKELVAYAKKNPGKVNAGGTFGSTSQFVILLLEDLAGVKFNHVSYDGTRQRMTALLAKNIDIGEINLAAAKKYIQTKELKALGITTAKRHPDIPNVMTLREQGFDLIYGTDRGVVAPKGTPKDVVRFWADTFERAAKDPEVAKQIQAKGTQINVLKGDDYRKYFEKTFAHWKRIAKKVGVYKRKD